MLQASPEYRMEPKDIYSLFTPKNRNGEMVPYSNFLTMERVFGPNQITRYNMFTSSLITGDAAPGVSSGKQSQRWRRLQLIFASWLCSSGRCLS